MNLKKGLKVKVYEDPLTQQKLEGEAVLIRKIAEYKNLPLEIWFVRFEDNVDVIRTIRKEVKDGFSL